jgi:hypothetical protein
LSKNLKPRLSSILGTINVQKSRKLLFFINCNKFQTKKNPLVDFQRNANAAFQSSFHWEDEQQQRHQRQLVELSRQVAASSAGPALWARLPTSSQLPFGLLYSAASAAASAAVFTSTSCCSLLKDTAVTNAGQSSLTASTFSQEKRTPLPAMDKNGNGNATAGSFRVNNRHDFGSGTGNSSPPVRYTADFPAAAFGADPRDSNHPLSVAQLTAPPASREQQTRLTRTQHDGWDWTITNEDGSFFRHFLNF